MADLGQGFEGTGVFLGVLLDGGRYFGELLLGFPDLLGHGDLRGLLDRLLLLGLGVAHVLGLQPLLIARHIVHVGALPPAVGSFDGQPGALFLLFLAALAGLGLIILLQVPRSGVLEEGLLGLDVGPALVLLGLGRRQLSLLGGSGGHGERRRHVDCDLLAGGFHAM